MNFMLIILLLYGGGVHEGADEVGARRQVPSLHCEDPIHTFVHLAEELLRGGVFGSLQTILERLESA